MKTGSFNLIVVVIGLAFFFSCSPGTKGKHLFILSGQSNMKELIPEESFIPAVTAEFGEENVIVVKHAQSGQPIRRWYRKWKSMQGDSIEVKADLYDSLMNRVRRKVANTAIATITLVWMQGERDAREELGREYKVSLEGLYNQLSEDLGRSDINFVIGRLSDFDLSNKQYPHWTMVRHIQEEVAASNPRFALVNTDDLNDGLDRKGKEIANDLHMSADGYKILGERFAAEAIKLIRNND